MSSQKRGWATAALLAVVMVMISSAVAFAATNPTATTSPASQVTATAATLNGTVAPNGNSTTYFFQYGTSTGYGTQTTPKTTNGNAVKNVSQSVTGLQPHTTYHFRLVATSTGGTFPGGDRSFTTAASGNSNNAVTIKAAPANVTWGRATTISGQVTGPKSTHRKVTLESTPYPYTAPFAPTGQTSTTSSTGGYSFTVIPTKNTHYEVVVGTNHPVTSAVAPVGVKVKVTFHVSTLKPASGQRVRFYGWVTPRHNGKWAQIQRRTSTGGWKTVSMTKLVSGGTTTNGVPLSKFSKRLRIFRGATYRIRVNPRDPAYKTGNSATHRLRVH